MTGRALGRRPLLVSLAGATVTGISGAGADAAARPRDLVFAIYRGGSEIGRQTFRFSAAETGFRCDVLIEVAVKIAFVTVYRYRQVGGEAWVDGTLRSSAIDTDDNGKRTRIRVAGADARLQVDGPAGSYEVDRGAMTDLGVWSPAIVRQAHVIDAQDGRLVPVTSRGPVEEVIVAGGEAVRARRYTMTGRGSRVGTLWFAPDDRLVQSRVMTRGEVVEFRLVG